VKVPAPQPVKVHAPPPVKIPDPQPELAPDLLPPLLTADSGGKFTISPEKLEKTDRELDRMIEALRRERREKAARAKKRRDEKREKTTRPGSKSKPRGANNSKKKP
jgi:hypothetical protein